MNMEAERQMDEAEALVEQSVAVPLPDGENGAHKALHMKANLLAQGLHLFIKADHRRHHDTEIARAKFNTEWRIAKIGAGFVASAVIALLGVIIART